VAAAGSALGEEVAGGGAEDGGELVDFPAGEAALPLA
jgi:hypothetical protein